jgi:hypothetical protein
MVLDFMDPQNAQPIQAQPCWPPPQPVEQEKLRLM